ncbi:YkgJ family cysteine cluster protein [Carboxylicivirga caseinilyticus]|uniref:YkgJ family cysteine cluster protein n=1 Tax=Carboxylicivirga caseinilyticus TaxID=3417572 RepID=UPI003D344028|nr:YkgJ family cysteine cluster protein [Marinilabiliaceae bacterium A049]
MSEQLDSYYALRNEIDSYVDYLWDEHQNHMACKKGCDLCCLDFDVFPVEFDAIKKQIEKEYPEILKADRQKNDEGACAYLKNHACTIYNARPIICRTHGFPLVNMNEAGDEWELSFCHLNFTNVEDDYFDDENIFEQDTYNSKLFVLNKAYLEANPGLNYSEKDLIPLKNIMG